jgi:Ricin-type beta-trefoil lectin domain
MTLSRRLAVGLVGASLILVGLAAAWVNGANAAVASTRLTAAIAQPHGVNFSIHSKVDPNFCMEDFPAPGNPASEASISQCAQRDDQHWTFADVADGTIVIIGGNIGNCLDFSAKTTVSMTPCTFGTQEHFFFNEKGQIESTSKKKCLQAVEAAQDAEIVIAKCAKDVALQDWTLSR